MLVGCVVGEGEGEGEGVTDLVLFLLCILCAAGHCDGPGMFRFGGVGVLGVGRGDEVEECVLRKWERQAAVEERKYE